MREENDTMNVIYDLSEDTRIREITRLREKTCNLTHYIAVGTHSDF